jgi:hypothetical protein
VTDVYVERLSVAALARAILAVGRGGGLLYFDSTRAGRLAARALAISRLAPPAEPVGFVLADVTDDSGANAWTRITEDLTRLATTIGHERFKDSSFLEVAGRRFTPERLLLFLEKGIALEFGDAVAFIHVAAWDARRRKQVLADERPADGRPIMLMRGRRWTPWLEALASDAGLASSRGRPRRVPHGGSSTHEVPVSGSTRRRLHQPPAAKPPPGAAVAHFYIGRTLTFDPVRRSEFFWVGDSTQLRERLLVCFERRPEARSLDAVAALGLPHAVIDVDSALRRLPRILVESRSARRATLSGIGLVLAAGAAHKRARGSFAFFLVMGLLRYVITYAFWLAFFERNPVAINMNEFDMSRLHLPMADALADRGGVSLTHQWSNLRSPSITLANSSDVVFAFGPAYEQLFRLNDTAAERIVSSGYMTDYIFEAVKNGADELRGRLKDAGARFVLCFFDENSSDGQMSLIPNDRTVQVHRFLLERVLEDPSFGLILKPGFPHTFYDRVAPIGGLIEDARKTGRLVILDSGGGVKTDAYPAEAAQAADLCVGLLLSGTASLEAWLAGKPAVFLDLEGLTDDPIYEYGQGRLVFPTLGELWDGIARFREDPASVPGFGDLSRWAEGRDPYRDGRAAHRISSYAETLLAELDLGRSRDEALAAADAAYRAAWGEGSVIEWR